MTAALAIRLLRLSALGSVAVFCGAAGAYDSGLGAAPGHPAYSAPAVYRVADRGGLRGGYDDGRQNRVAVEGAQREDTRNPYVTRIRGPIDECGRCAHTSEAARMITLRPYDKTRARDLESAEAETGNYARLSGDWRHYRHTQIVTSNAAATIPVFRGISLIGEVRDSWVQAKNVRRLDGSVKKLATNIVSGAAGFAAAIANGAEFKAEALYGINGPGGRIGYFDNWQGGDFQMAAIYHEPYVETAEGIADHASRDEARIAFSQRLMPGLWGRAELRTTRYGVRGDTNIAHTAGFDASLRYAQKIFGGLTAGLTYEVSGDYVFRRHKYLGLSPTPFNPLSIRTREIHAGSASLGIPLGLDLSADLYGGYAYDRYGEKGPFGGGEIRYHAAPGFDVALSGSYTKVSKRQGVTGAETTAGLKLIYKIPAYGPPGSAL